jgi:hypothetical protein
MAPLRRPHRLLLFWLVYTAGVLGVVGGALAGLAMARMTLLATSDGGGMGGFFLMLLLAPLLLAVCVPLGTLIGGVSAALVGALCVWWAAKRGDAVSG